MKNKRFWGIIKEMLTYIQTWRILRVLSNECIKSNSNFIGRDQTIEFIKNNRELFDGLSDADIEKMGNKLPQDSYIRLSLITGAFAEKSFWIWDSSDVTKKEKTKRLRMAQYKKLIDESKKAGLVEFMDKKAVNTFGGKTIGMYDDEEYVSITGPGFVFSRWDSLFNEIVFGKFKGWIAGLIFISSSVIFSSKITYLKSYVLKLAMSYLIG